MSKLYDKIEVIKKSELEYLELIRTRDSLQEQSAQVKNKLDNVKEKINFKDDELRKEYVELKSIITEGK